MNQLLKPLLLAHRAEDVGSPVEDEGTATDLDEL
jgi:hypothetical protein